MLNLQIFPSNLELPQSCTKEEALDHSLMDYSIQQTNEKGRLKKRAHRELALTIKPSGVL